MTEDNNPDPKTSLVVRELIKRYELSRGGAAEAVLAVNRVSFTVLPGQLFTLLGPSGCGKTTTLRCIAGLERPDSGEILVGRRTLFSSQAGTFVPAHRRGLGMVFQSYAIWPHMSVFDNVAFPLRVRRRRRRYSREEFRDRVERALVLVQLDELRHRRATQLSGGQQQRLALARAIVMEPPLLLLDEPLSNLDAQLREQMRFQLMRLQTEFGITAVYVTHDQVEALAISDAIAVMRDGNIEQIGTPREIYGQPSNRFVADFVGTTNFFEGRILRRTDTGTYTVEIDQPRGRAQVVSERVFAPGDEVAVSVRPEHLRFDADPEVPNGQNRWMGRVIAQAFLGEVVDHVVLIGDAEFRVRTNPSASLPEGSETAVSFSTTTGALVPGRA